MSPEQAPDGSIIITPKEFYDGVRKDVETIKDSISRVEQSISPLPQRLERAEDRLDRIESSLGKLSGRTAWLVGAATAAGAVVGALLPYLLT